MVLQLLELVLQMAAKAIYLGIYFHKYWPYVDRDQCRTQHHHLPATDVVKRLDGRLQCFGVGPMQSDPRSLIAFVDRLAELGAFFPIKVGIQVEDEPQWADLELTP